MSLDSREYKIILQNLLNRATEVEISDATVGNRKVDIANIEKNLSAISALVMKKLTQFEKGEQDKEEIDKRLPPKHSIKVN